MRLCIARHAAQLRITAAALSDAHRDAEANSKRALEVRVIAGTLITTVYCVCPSAPLPLGTVACCPLAFGFAMPCDFCRPRTSCRRASAAALVCSTPSPSCARRSSKRRRPLRVVCRTVSAVWAVYRCCMAVVCCATPACSCTPLLHAACARLATLHAACNVLWRAACRQPSAGATVGCARAFPPACRPQHVPNRRSERP